MGELSVRSRQSGVKGLPEGARLLERVARPLIGLEVKEALTRHILALAGEFDSESKTWERFEREIGNTLDRISELNKMNLVYPGVGWNVKVTLEQSELGLENLWALVQLDLEPGKRKNIAIGGSKGWKVFLEREEEQLQTRVPDTVRERHQLPIEVDYITPSGQRGKVARSVEIGGAAQGVPKIERDVEGLTSPEHQAEAREMAVQVSVEAVTPKEKRVC